MYRHTGQIFAFLTGAACVGVACAADPGDPQKTTNSLSGSSSSGGGFPSSSSSSSSSGGFGSSSSSSGGFGSSSSGGFGSSSSTSGSGGGNDGGSDAPTGPTTPSCATSASAPVIVAYYTQDTGAMPTSTVAFNLTLSNGSFGTVNLSDVTIRYWFTADGNAPSGMTFVSYYSSHDGTAICSPCPPAPGIVGTFNTAPAANLPADAYLELSFAASDGTIGAGLTGDTVAVQAAFHGPGTAYSDTFNETNDYSFDPTKKTSPGQQTTTITAYVQGQLVWGCEPGAGGSTTGAAGSSSSGAGSSSSGAADASSAVDAGGGAGDATVE